MMLTTEHFHGMLININKRYIIINILIVIITKQNDNLHWYTINLVL